MWICHNKAFVSIVDKAPFEFQGQDNLCVRARRPGDIAKVFPAAKEIKSPGNDYLYRAFINREVVAETIKQSILNIDYSNFKNSVADNDLHDVYASTWHVVGRLQDGGPYSSGSRSRLKAK